MKRARWPVLAAGAVAVLSWGALRAGEEAKPVGETAAESRYGLYYYDLGPDAVDVAGYPEAQRENYKIFAMTCSRCHTLARPLNAPMVKREDWKRYVNRMHLRGRDSPGRGFGGKDAEAVLDFLAYDSDIRKVKGQAAFAAQAEKLKRRFAQVIKAEEAKRLKADKKKVKPVPLYTGENPRP